MSDCFLTQIDVIKTISAENVRNLNLNCTCDSDGTSARSIYKLQFWGDNGSKSDANVFPTFVIPLQLISIHDFKPSPRLCRHIRIQMQHLKIRDMLYKKKINSKIIVEQL